MSDAARISPPAGETTHGHRRSHAGHKIIVAAELVLLVILFLFFLPVGGKSMGTAAYELVTDKPEFCATCHLMGTRYISHRRSAHGRAAVCMDCHSEPGGVGWLKAHIGGARYLYAIATGSVQARVIQTKVSSEACVKCHTSGCARVPPGPHLPRIRDRDDCTTCHGRAAVHRLSPPASGLSASRD